ncbi:transporter [Endozoicomonas sp. OPT23]|uniref:peptide antibiotic transporter SbmA n=1 Tax=Endozoicomonas sp. OPT23 TaxID=2072845 RepID=UPI00129A6D98|nr:peptide antibiotic transporter SbmA [Endozoicomonas sp. OPT23]MRI32939.1 transporter [Endozoicomonas sp. OPT23]
MFKSFFLNKKWLLWSLIGSTAILLVTWYKVQLDVRINEWFGSFYNTIQESLGNPGKHTFDEFLAQCLQFAEIAGIYIVVAVLLDFFIKHYVFRWRTAMNEYYMANWHKVRHIEGAAQRVQEDTMRFARIMESLGVAFMRSLMTLVAFLPILWGLSSHVTELPWIGHVEHAFVFIAIISAATGTVLLAAVGIKLPGLEFNNQRVEAAYRKELVLGEDHAERADPPTVKELFGNVRKNYFTLYLHYLYFDVAKWSYLQFTVIVPYIAMGPTIVAGAITLGVMQQVIRAFGRVEESFQFLVNSWGVIVELISIYKRLKAFEQVIDDHSEGVTEA